jgi:hypothetical protein
MDTMTYAEFKVAVDTYVYDMIAEHLSAYGTLPQTVVDYDECMNEVMECGIMEAMVLPQ